MSLIKIFASWLIYTKLGFDPNSKIGISLHFFVEDTIKIYFLLIVMIYIIAIIRASLNIEKVRDFLSQKHKFIGYSMGSLFGAITPFCSCSSIPVFLGFTSAGLPIGITMSFLITSPLINEVAVILLLSLVGWEITLIYIVSGIAVGILSGIFLYFIHAEKWLQSFALKAYQQSLSKSYTPASTQSKLTFQERHQFAKQELFDIFSRVWKWVLGFVPIDWFTSNLGQGQWWSVPIAVFIGIPLYSNATGVIPVMESLLLKGLPLGTTMAFCMSTIAASFPEFVLLKQVMQWKLLTIIFLMLLFAFTIIGWILNFTH